MALVTVLVKRDCAHCRGAIDHVAALAGEHEIPVAAQALEEHPTLAGEAEPGPAPAVRFDGGPTHVGVPDPQTLAALVEASTFEGHGPAKVGVR